MSEDAPVNTGAVQWPDPDSAYFAVRRLLGHPAGDHTDAPPNCHNNETRGAYAKDSLKIVECPDSVEG